MAFKHHPENSRNYLKKELTESGFGVILCGREAKKDLTGISPYIILEKGKVVRMKLKTTKSSVQTSDNFQSLNFSIKNEDMGIILDILRSKMYKHPISSICREIASNSRDANREAGKSKTPIRIELDKNEGIFSVGESVIAFHDDGVGISPDRMADVFVNYGSSTKRDTNKQTGGFGLGAKTPFAYSDQFAIITRYDGTEYTYIAAIEENNTGKMYLVTSSKTDNCNGTSVIIPVQNNDISSFEREVIKATILWTVKPNYIGFSRQAIPENISKENIDNGFIAKLNNTSYFSDAIYLLIDDIPYPVDREQFSDLKIPSYNNGAVLFLSFKTGELNISANREQIRYDESTIKKITKRYNDIIETLKKRVESDFDSCKNYLEACVKYSQYYRKQSGTNYGAFCFLEQHGVGEHSYKGKELHKYIEIKNARVYRRFEDGTKQHINEISPSEIDTDFYLIDTWSITNGRQRTLNAMYSGKSYFTIETHDREIRISKWQQMSFSEKKRYCTRMRNHINSLRFWIEGGLSVKLYSQVQSTRAPSGSRVKKEKNIIVTKTPSSSTIGRIRRRHFYDGSKKIILEHSHIDITNFDKNNIAYIVLTKSELHQTDGRYSEKVSELLEQALWMKKNHGVDVHFITVESEREKYLKGKVFKMEDMMKNIISANTKDIQNECDRQYISNSLTVGINQFDKLIFGTNGYRDAIKLIEKTQTTAKAINFPKKIFDGFTPSKTIKEAVKETNEIFNRYPLLKHVNSYMDKSEIKEFNEYIMMCDLTTP